MPAMPPQGESASLLITHIKRNILYIFFHSIRLTTPVFESIKRRVGADVDPASPGSARRRRRLWQRCWWVDKIVRAGYLAFL